jgi:hypothetical protein
LPHIAKAKAHIHSNNKKRSNGQCCQFSQGRCNGDMQKASADLEAQASVDLEAQDAVTAAAAASNTPATSHGRSPDATSPGRSPDAALLEDRGREALMFIGIRAEEIDQILKQPCSVLIRAINEVLLTFADDIEKINTGERRIKTAENLFLDACKASTDYRTAVLGVYQDAKSILQEISAVLHGAELALNSGEGSQDTIMENAQDLLDDLQQQVCSHINEHKSASTSSLSLGGHPHAAQLITDNAYNMLLYVHHLGAACIQHEQIG